MRTHLSARAEAKARVRDALERQILLANPEARDAGLEHLTEDALQAFVEEKSVGRRGTSAELAGSARRLREVEQNVAELRNMMAQFAMIVEAQSELVGRAGRNVEAANLAVHTAEEQLELAKEANDVYQRAKWLLILCLFVVVFILGGGLGSLPEWLGFLRGRSAVEVRDEVFATPYGLLKDKHPRVRKDMASYLGLLGPAASEHSRALAGMLGDKVSEVRTAAAQALGEIGRPAAEHARALARMPEDTRLAREIKAWALGRMVAVNQAGTLVRLLGDLDPTVRKAAAKSLGQMGPAAARHAGELVPLLKDKTRFVRLAAAEALGKMGAEAAPHTRALVGLLVDEDAKVRKVVGRVLEKMGEAGAVALAAHLASKRRNVRKAAVFELGQMGMVAAEHASGLAGLLTDSDEQVRKAAGWALTKMGTAGAVALAERLTDKERHVRKDAAESLGMMGSVAAEHSKALAGLLTDEDAGIRWAAVWALGKLGTAAAEHVDAIAGLLAEQDKDTRRAAAWALGQMGPAAAEHAKALAGLLADGDADIRRSGAEALGRIGPAAAEHAEALAGLRTDTDADVRVAAAAALRKMGSAGVTAVRTAAKHTGDAREARRAFVELVESPNRSAVLNREPRECQTWPRRAQDAAERALLSEGN
jgi:HEAT repeat protein